MSESTVKINAIVVRAKDSGENDRLLTLLSPEMGKLSVSAKGVKSLKHKSRSACMPLAYSSFVLKKIKDGLYSLSSADLIESFSSLSLIIRTIAPVISNPRKRILYWRLAGIKLCFPLAAQI